MKVSLRLKIAETIIEMRSRFALVQLTEDERRKEFIERFSNFFYKGTKAADIIIDVEVVEKLPPVMNATPIFTAYHFHDQSENWHLLKRGKYHYYHCPLDKKRQLVRVNNTFDRARAYMLPRDKKAGMWNVGDVIYDFLQVMLINYFAQRKWAIFTHAIGIKDVDGRGLLFAGKSGCGKSTTAKIWYRHSKAMILNDDRMIVRRRNGGFYIYGSPWHGEFSDYLVSRIEAAPLRKLFFISHSAKHKIRPVTGKETFSFLYPAIFPTFWDKKCLGNIVSFASELIKKVPCYDFGFVNDKTVINFVRKI